MTEPLFATGIDDLPGPARMRAMTGLAFMEAMRAGTLPHPPIARAMAYRLASVEPGRVIFSGTPEFDHTNPMGTVHGGWYGTLLDSCMGCAVMTLLPEGAGYTTLEYKINILRPIPLGTDVLAEGVSRHAGRSTGVAEGRITGAADGRLYAIGSTTCLILAG